MSLKCGFLGQTLQSRGIASIVASGSGKQRAKRGSNDEASDGIAVLLPIERAEEDRGT